MPYPRIEERKHHLNKPDETYLCDELHRDMGTLVLRYDVTQDGRIGPVAIPAGSLTIAHYSEEAAHVLWENYAPDRSLIGYCYHVCEPPQIGEDFVEYLDLMLDLWFDPKGNLTVLDEDEFAAAQDERLISAAEIRTALRELETLPQRHADIIAGLWRPEGGVEAL
jgi:hypothetical protein